MNFRDLLDWISGKKPEETTPAIQTGRERRRFYRIDLADGEVFLDRQGPFGVVNLSFGGLRIRLGDSEWARGLPLGRKLPSQIRLERIQFACELEVCNLWQDEIGCSFVNLPATCSRMLSDFLKPRILGSSLKEINASALRNPDENLRLRWFQGDDGTQIFLWQSLEGDVVKEEFYFMDYIIAMDRQRKSFQVGAIQQGLAKAGFGRIDAGSIAFFKVPSFRALKMGRVILESASLPQEAREHLLATIVTEERRLYSRYMLSENERQVRFFPGKAALPPLDVLNLSLKGIAFMAPVESRTAGLAPGNELVGELHLPTGTMKAMTRIVYIHDHVLGGSLSMEDAMGMEALAAFLGPRLLGQSLEEVPPPVEVKPFAPPGSRSYLFIGVHNTHLLSLIAPGGRLVFGRISFMDFALVSERNQLSAFSCPRGIIFPSDWELPMESVDRIEGDYSDWKNTCRQMLEVATIPAEVQSAWKGVLGDPGKTPERPKAA